MKVFSEKIHSLLGEVFTIPDEPAAHGDPNPWLSGRRHWNEVFGTLVSSSRFLMRMAVASWILSALLAGGLVAAALKPRFTPYVIEVNSEGSVLSAGVPTQKSPEEKYIHKELSEWLINFRSVVRDSRVQRRFVDKVYAYLIQTDPAARTVTDWYSKNDPFERSSRQLVVIEVESVLSLSTKTWQIEWQETQSDLGGQPSPPVRYRGILTTEFFEIKTAESISQNPFGIFIKDLSISRIGD